MMNYQQIHYWYSRDEFWTGILKGFDIRIEAMGLNCPYGNAEGIKFDDLVSCGQILVHVGALRLQYRHIHAANDSAPVQTRVWPRKIINDCKRIVTLVHSSCRNSSV